MTPTVDVISPRTAIRQRVTALLRAALPLWDVRLTALRIHESRAIPLSPKKLPAVLIYTRDERLEEDAGHSDPGLRRTLELRDDGATLTTPKLLVDAPQSEFTGHVLIQRGLTVYNSDGTGTAEIVGDIKHRDGDYVHNNGNHVQSGGSHIVAGGDVTADGIGLKPHRHVEQGDGAPTSSSIA